MSVVHSKLRAMRRKVKSTNIARILQTVLILTVLCGIAKAEIAERAPQFTAHALDGETLTNSSLSGNVVLLQFWATWCPYCRRDQSVLDSLEREFTNEGLIVLAVDVGESEAVVRKYLAENPRSCRVILNNGLAARFGAHGFPYYVLIDRNGNIAGTQNGSGGEMALRHLLSRAGLGVHSDTRNAGNHESASSPSSGRVKVIEAPRTESARPPKPNPKTIFVFANGERLEAEQYTIDAGFLHVVTGGQQRTIALGTLDLKMTIAVNHERGIDIKIPQSRSEVTIAF